MDLAAATGAPIIRIIGGQEYRFKLTADDVGVLMECIRNQRREDEKRRIREAVAETGEKLTTDQWIEKLRDIDTHGIGLVEMYQGITRGQYIIEALELAVEAEDPAATIKAMPMSIDERIVLCLELLGLYNPDEDKGSAEGNVPKPEPTGTG